MNFTPFSVAGTQTSYVTSAPGQFQNANTVQKFQTNGTLGQVVVDNGIQYVRALDGGAQLTAQPQIITLPISVPGAKPGDPPQTVQIQVVPNIALQQNVQTPKYQMQIPIQGFQPGAAFLTVAYAQDGMDNVQLVGNALPEGLQVVAALPQDIQLMTQDQKEQSHQHQGLLLPTSIGEVISDNEEKKILINNNNNNSTIKQEYSEMNDEGNEEFILGDANTDGSIWDTEQNNINEYINKLPNNNQMNSSLPISLQQYLKFNTHVVKVEGSGGSDSCDGDKNTANVADIENNGDADKQKKKKKKSYRKPPKPAKPKPGQVVIATALDGTTIYCCPMCHMAYPEKDHLEQHLVTHKIERRFICGICGAGLKRKEHLERHKLGHKPERPYVCKVCMKGFKRKEHLNLHTVIHSGEKREICQECGKGFYRKDHLRKHTRAHQNRRAKEEGLLAANNQLNSNQSTDGNVTVTPLQNSESQQQVIGSNTPGTTAVSIKPLCGQNIMPEITIHVPTSSNVQVPVQISVPQHVISMAQHDLIPQS